MRLTFHNQVHLLKESANRFDPISNETRLQSLTNLSSLHLPYNKDLIAYFESLLFIIAYPSDSDQLLSAEKEILRITKFLKEHRKKDSRLFDNSGMSFTRIITRFSHDTVRWLINHPHVTTNLNSFEKPSLQLNDVLRLTLTSLEKGETTAGHTNTELMDALLVREKQQLQFLINELARLDHLPNIKDHLFERLELFVCVIPLNKTFSKAFNRIPISAPFFHKDLLKKIDEKEILNKSLPPAATISHIEELIRVIKNSMVLTARETDPATFLEENSILLYHLERGISIAIYGLIPSRQLPLESYVGFTVFKNGFPVAYGGGWVFGERANFGLNIFETFRNGESGYIMAQILRVYKQTFTIRYFEVEPFQFGLDNPEGIESGAFWFYYRFGFRPIDPLLRQLSKKEFEKIKAKKNYRTSHKTLIRFTQSSIGLKLGKTISPKVLEITSRVTRMIQGIYHGDRVLAEEDCRKKFLENTKMKTSLNDSENQVLTEVALWSEAFNVKDRYRLQLMVEMIYTKPKDVYAYQPLIIKFFSHY